MSGTARVGLVICDCNVLTAARAIRAFHAVLHSYFSPVRSPGSYQTFHIILHLSSLEFVEKPPVYSPEANKNQGGSRSWKRHWNWKRYWKFDACSRIITIFFPFLLFLYLEILIFLMTKPIFSLSSSSCRYLTTTAFHSPISPQI